MFDKETLCERERMTDELYSKIVGVLKNAGPANDQMVGTWLTAIVSAVAHVFVETTYEINKDVSNEDIMEGLSIVTDGIRTLVEDLIKIKSEK